MNITDTIAAVSTPPGEGGISVIRISGDRAFEITSKVFSRSAEGKQKIDFTKVHTHTIHFGYVIENGNLIDEALLSVFRNPHSYTGEDTVEISSHGGTLISKKILDALIAAGARHAEPGEFTRRAFTNGKIDLAQAEAVADLIRAKTDAAHSSSLKQLEGSLSELVGNSREEIINIISLVELELDFAEEGLELIKKEEIIGKIQSLVSKLERVISSYISGRVIREGVNLVIAGKPNSGKSSLFNYLLKSNRAIVSTVPGTTRDYIEESIIINGILFNLTDTAGLRLSTDEIESEGIRRSHTKISEADFIVYLSDSSADENTLKEDYDYFKKTFADRHNQAGALFVHSKIDASEKKFEDGLPRVSIHDDESVEKLKTVISSKVSESSRRFSSGEIILTNERHRICLENVVRSLNTAVKSAVERMSGEFISVDLRSALSYLGEITGEVTNDDILNNIFKNFCIGK